jgi:flagellar hook-associated protein 2
MANASIGGLVSGLDTATIISQLMQLEARPQTMLKSKVSVAERAVTAMQTLNAKLAAIGTKAGDLVKLSGWSPMTASSDSPKVSVTASSTATPATLSLTVEQVATKSVLDFGTHALTDKVLSDGSNLVSFTQPDGTTATVDTKDGTVQGLVNAINSGDHGATATLLQVAPGEYRLQVTADTEGPTSMSLAPPSGSAATAITGTLSQGLVAKITVGTSTIESSTNLFTGLMPGVDVTLGTDAVKGETATITIGADAQSLVVKVKGLVETLNGALDELASLTRTGADAKDRGMLAGDSTLRGVRDKLIESVTHGVNGESLATYGIQVDRYGKVTFDETKFKAAYAADPNGTAAMFAGADDTTTTDGFAGTLQSLSKTFSDSIDGTVSLSIKSRQAAISGWEDDIADWDIRLAARQVTLQRQYTALESALGKLQSQGSWLAGQIASLPQMSSGM